jgi:hypothetical protein
VPEVAADEHADAAEARLEHTHAVARGEVAALVEDAVRRKVDLAVHVDERAAVEERGGVEVLAARRLLDEADGDRGRLRDLGEPLHLRRVERDRCLGRRLHQHVAGERELGEDDELRARLRRALRGLGVQVEVRGDVGELRHDLRQGGLHGAQE